MHSPTPDYCLSRSRTEGFHGALLAYAQKTRAQQASALDRMADNARELGLHY